VKIELETVEEARDEDLREHPAAAPSTVFLFY